MKYPIIILHGWGKRASDYSAIKELLENKYSVFVPDLPGFGNNQLKKAALVFDDYISFTHSYITAILKKTEQKKVILIGHSFGGRIGIRFSGEYPELVGKLILTGASGIPRPLPSFKKKAVYFVTKMAKSVFLIPPFSLLFGFFRKLVYYSIGEMDYYKSGTLKQTFKNVYQVSIVDDLKKIHAKTLIIWGQNDTITPLVDGKFMHQHIPGSKFVIIANATHKLPYEHPEEFTKEVIKFL